MTLTLCFGESVNSFDVCQLELYFLSRTYKVYKWLYKGIG